MASVTVNIHGATRARAVESGKSYWVYLYGEDFEEELCVLFFRSMERAEAIAKAFNEQALSDD